MVELIYCGFREEYLLTLVENIELSVINQSQNQHWQKAVVISEGHEL